MARGKHNGKSINLLSTEKRLKSQLKKTQSRVSNAAKKAAEKKKEKNLKESANRRQNLLSSQLKEFSQNTSTFLS